MVAIVGISGLVVRWEAERDSLYRAGDRRLPKAPEWRATAIWLKEILAHTFLVDRQPGAWLCVVKEFWPTGEGAGVADESVLESASVSFCSHSFGICASIG